MPRLTDLIAQAKAKDSDLGTELERQFRVLSSRPSFGLNFESHRPESVELSGRPVRKGDNMRILSPCGSTRKGDQRLRKVLGFEKPMGRKLLDATEPERKTVPVDDPVVVAEFRDYIYPGLISTGKVERGGNACVVRHARRQIIRLSAARTPWPVAPQSHPGAWPAPRRDRPARLETSLTDPSRTAPR